MVIKKNAQTLFAFAYTNLGFVPNLSETYVKDLLV